MTILSSVLFDSRFNDWIVYSPAAVLLLFVVRWIGGRRTDIADETERRAAESLLRDLMTAHRLKSRERRLLRAIGVMIENTTSLDEGTNRSTSRYGADGYASLLFCSRVDFDRAAETFIETLDESLKDGVGETLKRIADRVLPSDRSVVAVLPKPSPTIETGRRDPASL